ncbi:signal peptidase II [Amphritea sp. 1_MG-2023]|uniref:signal peptidase II n=1 Tax=Amphritea sp. 1_MG-2023 TaxID=3062670 RepID=UPI0026E481E1|nr:signal peptidase II [Amphritea sp. 1_MG-2023]MDO6563640.1 signal peptidase II [Amphritea sp. 1_MG-2023]
MSSSRSALPWLWLAALVIVLDLFTKYQASRLLPYGIAHPQLPVFDLTLLHNTGAAFSFLASAGGWQRWLFALIALLVSVVLVIWIARTPRQQRWLGAGLALVLGGALGNLYDRVVHGYVVDFISLHYNGYYFPAFNLADTAITIGAGMLIIDMIWSTDNQNKSK